MSDNLYVRMTIDVAVFEGTKGRGLMEAIIESEGTATLGIGETLSRKVMEAIKRGDIEIDDIRDIEDHT